MPPSIHVEEPLQPCLVETSRVEVLKRAKDTALTRIVYTDSVPQ